MHYKVTRNGAHQIINQLLEEDLELVEFEYGKVCYLKRKEGVKKWTSQ